VNENGSSAVAPDAADVLDTPQAGSLALRGSALRAAGYGGGMLLALIAVPLLIRHLHQVGFGRYTTALSIATIAATITEGGVSTIALREFTAKAGARRNDVMASLLGLRLLFSALGVLAALTFATLAGYSSTLVLGTVVASVGMSMQVLQQLLTVPLQAQLRLGWVAAGDLVRNAVNTALVVAVVLAGGGIVPLLAVITPAGLAAVVLITGLIRGSMPLRPSLRFRTYALLLREIFPFAVAIALSSVYFRLTVVAMSLDSSAVQTGYFSTSFRVVEVLIGLPTIVIGTAYPIIVRAQRDNPERFAYASRRMFELSVLVGGLAALGLVLGASFITDVLGGRAAAPAAPVLRIQGLAVMGTFVAVACGFPLLSMRRYPAVLVANAAGLVVTLAVSLALIPALSARGAAIATVAAEFALAGVSVVALRRADSTVRLPLDIVPITLVAGGIGVGAGFLVAIHPVIDVVVGSCVYGLVLVMFRRFPPELRHHWRMIGTRS